MESYPVGEVGTWPTMYELRLSIDALTRLHEANRPKEQVDRERWELAGSVRVRIKVAVLTRRITHQQALDLRRQLRRVLHVE